MIVNDESEIVHQANQRKAQFIRLTPPELGTTRSKQSTMNPTECPIIIKLKVMSMLDKNDQTKGVWTCLNMNTWECAILTSCISQSGSAQSPQLHLSDKRRWPGPVRDSHNDDLNIKLLLSIPWWVECTESFLPS